MAGGPPANPPTLGIGKGQVIFEASVIEDCR